MTPRTGDAAIYGEGQAGAGDQSGLAVIAGADPMRRQRCDSRPHAAAGEQQGEEEPAPETRSSQRGAAEPADHDRAGSPITIWDRLAATSGAATVKVARISAAGEVEADAGFAPAPFVGREAIIATRRRPNAALRQLDVAAFRGDADLDRHAEQVGRERRSSLPDNGTAWRGSRTTATRIRSRLPTMPLVGSNSTQPAPGR